MPARRCTTCNLGWPNEMKGYGNCPVCESPTWFSPNSDALAEDEAKSVIAEMRAEAATKDQLQAEAPSPAHAWRVACYLELGFTAIDAEMLALAETHHRDTKGRTWTRPLNHLIVAEALSQGCTHARAMEVFA